jgi:DNA-binding PadR family transcriptional regulator
MGKRYRADPPERVTVAALKTNIHENYKPVPSNGNFRASLNRLVARGYLVEHVAVSRTGSKAPSYQLTDTGIIKAMAILADDEKNRPPAHKVFL